MRALILATVVVGAGFAALAHDMDDPFVDWFVSLRQPDEPSVSCCGPADQVYVTSYQPSTKEHGGFTAMVNGKTVEIPAKKVIWDRPNPTGRGVLFLQPVDVSDTPTIYCFVPGVGT